MRQYYHGDVKFGEPQTSAVYRFRTLDPSAPSPTISVWTDTHENVETLRALHDLTAALKPDVLLWNGNQSNGVHFEQEMAGQFLTPAWPSRNGGRWPMCAAITT